MRDNSVDHVEARKFLHALWAGNEGYGEFRLIKTGEKTSPRKFFKPDAIVWNEIAEAEGQGRSIYFGVCQRKREGGKKADVGLCNAFWADLDAKDFGGSKEKALSQLTKLPSHLQPSIIVDSGHGYHFYWLLREPEAIKTQDDIKRIEGYVKGLEIQLGGDSVHDVSRVMRVPGTMNVKEPERPVPCTLVKFDPSICFNPEDFEGYRVEVETTKEKVKLGDIPSELPERFHTLLGKNRVITLTWEGKNTNLKDQSGSGYDMAMANHLVAQEFIDEEIVCILRHMPSGRGLEAREDYLSRTIGKAREGYKKGSESKKKEERSQSTRLIELVDNKGGYLFHTPDMEPHATLKVDKHKETMPLSSKSFEDWLKGSYWKEYGKASGSQAVTDAVGVLSARAKFEGKEHPVFTRVAMVDGNVHVNLAGPCGKVVEVTPTGWTVLDESEPRFIKSASIGCMPEPQRDGAIEALKEFLNIPNDEAWYLTVTWLVATFLKGPFAVAVIVGEAGSAKSTFTRVLSRLVDESEAELRSLPHNERDLMVSAVNGHVLAYDNISSMKPWLSDTFCKLATGAALSTRSHYTNSEETILKAKRPLVLNGIDDIATRGDLLRRSILISLVPMEEKIPELEFWVSFQEARAGILGSLLDTLSKVLSIRPTLKGMDSLGMADFALTGVAVEKALGWPEGSFLDAYKANIGRGNSLPLESLFATTLISFTNEREEWEGTATSLLSSLVGHTGREFVKDWDWPKTSQGVGNTLRRLAPNLRKVGIDVSFPGRTKYMRCIRLVKIEERALNNVEKTSSSLSPSSNSCLKGDKGDISDGSFSKLYKETETVDFLGGRK